jgi:diacylglycerol kinase (CTP)
VLATVLVTVIVPADAIRLHYPQFERLYEKCVGFLMRESERVRSASLSPLFMEFFISI